MKLQWFAESGSTGDGGTAASSDAGSNVAQGGAPQGQDAADHNSAPEKRSFEELIRGEYKQDFDKRVQQIIRERLKSRGRHNAAQEAAPALTHQPEPSEEPPIPKDMETPEPSETLQSSQAPEDSQAPEASQVQENSQDSEASQAPQAPKEQEEQETQEPVAQETEAAKN